MIILEKKNGVIAINSDPNHRDKACTWVNCESEKEPIECGECPLFQLDFRLDFTEQEIINHINDKLKSVV